MNRTKRQRQQALVTLVQAEPLSSQEDIRRRLATLGHPATQSTISRDLEELGLVRVRDGNGQLHYALPGETRAGRSPAAMRALLQEFAVRVEHSGNLVVLFTPPGAASTAARAIDQLEPEGVLGTIAGDDTVVVVVREGAGAGGVAAGLRSLAGLS